MLFVSITPKMNIGLTLQVSEKYLNNVYTLLIYLPTLLKIRLGI